MNLVLIPPQENLSGPWQIHEPRQVMHLREQLNLQVGDTLKVGILGQARYLTRVMTITAQSIEVMPLQQEACPKKLPVTLIVALPRPKVLRRLIMDSVTLGVERICLIHSYRVDKSYWQTPFLQQLDDYVQLGLEQAGDTIAPHIQLYKRFKPFVEDILPGMIQPERPAYVAHPYSAQTMPINISHGCSLIIGPEGGFIPYEVELMQKNGCQTYQLGSRILRTETAVSYVLGRLFS